MPDLALGWLVLIVMAAVVAALVVIYFVAGFVIACYMHLKGEKVKAFLADMVLLPAFLLIYMIDVAVCGDGESEPFA